MSNRKSLKNGKHKSIFLTHYYCRECENHILHKIAIWHKTEKQNYPICPHKTCKHSRLQTVPRNSKDREKFKKQLKLQTLELEAQK